ncbi:MAG: ricin-type beta-trefoil lectin domain protein [Kineosporiaceae bacterium]
MNRTPPRPRRRRRSRALPATATAILTGSALMAPAVHASALENTSSPRRVTPLAAAAWQAEHLDRGAVAVPSSTGVLVSWRLLATDPQSIAFNVYRGSTKLNSTPLTSSTNYLDRGQSSGSGYTVRAVVNGVEQAAASALAFGSGGYLDVPISSPGSGYTANDASAGDLDGDGDLDLVLKWYPNNAKDNSQSGATDNTYLDGITLEGKRLWRINLGRNIRSGAHYAQFQVFDYDGDGKAEVAVKTADGTTDGTGKVIGDASKDYRNSGGYVLSGPEFLSVFSGPTGAVLATTTYDPPRGDVGAWGDTYGNRVDRFLAGTAYLDGVRPSIIMARGYYTRSVIAAWDWRGGKLTKRWTFDSNSAGSRYTSQGNHQLSIADVDGDGRDEVMYGSMAIDDNGAALWNNNTHHGDAYHVGDLIPSRPGLEVFKPSEHTDMPADWLADARTGAIIWQHPSCKCDNGRGVAADIYAGNPGAEAWSSAVGSLTSAATGAALGRKPGSANFLAWWDGDPLRELLDSTHIDKYTTSGDNRVLTASNVHTGNGTKSNPSLSGDLWGDWREEVIWPTSDDRALRIYSTPIATDRRMVTLLHDRQYREAIAWQNTAYNQPPHPSFFIGDGMTSTPWPTVFTPGGSTTTPTPTDTTPTPTDTPSVLSDTFESGATTGWVTKAAQKLTLSVVSGGATTPGKALQVTGAKKVKVGPKRQVDVSGLKVGQWYQINAAVKVASGQQPAVFTVAPQQKIDGAVSYPARSAGGWATTVSAFQWQGKGKVTLAVTTSTACDADAVPSQFLLDDVTITPVASKPSGSATPSCTGGGGDPGDGGTAGPLKGVGSQRCLAAPTATPGTLAVLADCTGGENQTWSLTPSGQLRVYGSTCLQPASSPATNGARAVTGPCSDASATTWTVSGSTVTHVASGLCLDAVARGTAAGTEIEVYTCNGGTNQQWARS